MVNEKKRSDITPRYRLIFKFRKYLGILLKIKIKLGDRAWWLVKLQFQQLASMVASKFSIMVVR